MNAVRIDISQIPEVDLNNLCEAFLEDMKAYYNDPENLRRANEKIAHEQREAERARQGS